MSHAINQSWLLKIYPYALTLWGRAMHICVGKLTIIGSDNLDQCRNIVNLTLRNKVQWNLNQYSYIFIEENPIQNVVCKMAAILPRLRCVKSNDIHTHFYSQRWLSDPSCCRRRYNVMATCTEYMELKTDKGVRWLPREQGSWGLHWDRQDPGGSHVGPMNFATWVTIPPVYNTISVNKWSVQTARRRQCYLLYKLVQQQSSVT